MFLSIRYYNILRTSGIKRFFSFAVNQKMSNSEGNGITLAEVINTLEDFAPKALSESWDNTGLLVQPYTERYVFINLH